MSKRFDIDDILPILRNVVRDFGEDYIYEPPDGVACVYFDDAGGPSCLIGQILYRLGATPGCVPNGTITSAVERADFPLSFTDGAVEVMQVAQMVQDGCSSWGRALEAAEARATILKAHF